ncbi:MAG TPA: Kdo hydroxylase family protein [Casimicrobiaceae bacterium]|nr:Kdo hydroxylase family protein [Casimicrobiaceae bacterium]
MVAIVALDVAGWRPSLAGDEQERAIGALEGGGVLMLPRLAFELADDERRFLSPRWSDGRSKNISFDGQVLKGARGSADELHALSRLVARFAVEASGLVAALLPRYAQHLKRARTSFRPQPAVGRAVSWRKDDSRLHVDAFPSRPNHGERILRVFSNVSPGEDRVWRVGEDFEAVARRFLPHIRRQWPGEPRLLAALHVTRGLRTAYDHLMLGLHDGAKADLEYQSSCAQQTIRFAPGTTWLCFSDQLMHAAVSGQYMLEQTIDLPIAALYDRERSPLAILQRLCGNALVAAA